MSDVDWTLYADGVCESLNRATTVSLAAVLAADGMAYALDRVQEAGISQRIYRRHTAEVIAAAYRATIARLTEDGPR